MSQVNIQIPTKLMPFLQKKKRFKVAYGGRGGAKSQSFADMLLMKSQTEGDKILCLREYQNTIDDSVHALLKSEIDRLGAEGFTVDKAQIYNTSGGEFKFRGLARGVSGVKSFHGFKKAWIEEAQSLSGDSLKILTPTIREIDAELWFSLNLMSSTDPMSQRFIEPFRYQLDKYGYYEDDLHLIIKINWRDNPWWNTPACAGLRQEREYDYEHLSRAEYDHIWEGAYNDSVEGSIILPEWFDAAIDAHIRLGYQPAGIKVVSFDPADEPKVDGKPNDEKGLVVRHGSVITGADIMKNGDAADGMDWALMGAINEQADFFNWDCDGLGLGLKRQVITALTGKPINWEMFKGSEGVDRPNQFYDFHGPEYGNNQKKTNLQVFRNKRAQYYGDLRDCFWCTYQAVTKGRYMDPNLMISISSKIECLIQLRSEVCRIPKKANAMGYFQIMNKQEMRRLKINSPALADSSMMSRCIPSEHNKKIRGRPVIPVHTPVIATPSMGF